MNTKNLVVAGGISYYQGEATRAADDVFEFK